MMKQKTVLSLLAVNLLAGAAWPAHGEGDRVSALGRIEPQGGVIRVAAPSTPEAISGAVVAELHVEEGDHVNAGELLAVTETAAIHQARVEEAMAGRELAARQAEAAASEADEVCVRAEQSAREAKRRQDLLARGLASEEETEVTQGDAEARAASCLAARARTGVAEAEIALADARIAAHQVEMERSHVRSPISGHVLEIHTHPGEVALEEGVLEIGATDNMVAIAEVWETDIRRLHEGQGATIRGDAFEGDLRGTISKIQMKVGKQDQIGTDPAARKDARVIEVEIALEEPQKVQSLTHLQVEVVFDE